MNGRPSSKRRDNLDHSFVERHKRAAVVHLHNTVDQQRHNRIHRAERCIRQLGQLERSRRRTEAGRYHPGNHHHHHRRRLLFCRCWEVEGHACVKKRLFANHTVSACATNEGGKKTHQLEEMRQGGRGRPSAPIPGAS